jgi:hypothetical protein
MRPAASPDLAGGESGAIGGEGIDCDRVLAPNPGDRALSSGKAVCCAFTLPNVTPNR